MSIFEPSSPRWTGRMLSLLRIIVGLLFLEHGTQKLFGFPPSPVLHAPLAMMSQLGVAGILETVGGLAIVIGLFTRPVAFLLAGEMAVAYFQVHFPKSVFPVVSGGELAMLDCFIFLYFVFAGPGPWSIDAMIAGARRRDHPGETPRRHINAAA